MEHSRGRGFAAMDVDLQKTIARKGGIAAHQKGRAHQFNGDEARSAGRKGGLRVSRDREHMSLIGRHGGQARSARALAARLAGAAPLTPEAGARPRA